MGGPLLGYVRSGGQDNQWQHTFRSKEAVIEVKPTDDCANVESSTDWVELVVGPRDLGS